MKGIVLVFCLLFSFSLRAETVLSVESGMAFMGDSGVPMLGTLERDELGTTFTKGVSIGYQKLLWGGRIRGLLGYDILNADGDWGLETDEHAIVRQTADVETSGFVLGGEYDFLQAGTVYPFIGAGIRLNINRPASHATKVIYHDAEFACDPPDDSDTYSFGYHALAGVGYDYGPWTVRVFYQYTDRGTADLHAGRCPSWAGKSLDIGTMHIRDHDVRIRLSYSF